MPISGRFRASRDAPWAQADGLDVGQAQELYAAHGPAMLQRLRQPFALALWDGTTLLLARDAFGEKPLLYCEKNGELWFASDLPSLKKLGAPLGQIDRGALSDYLELLYVPSPSSIWSGVRKLPAGHLLRAGELGVEVRRWFELPESGSSETRPSRIAVRARLEEAVREHAPKGATLLIDGGLPSLALLALATRRHGKVRTLSTESDPLARRIAHRFRAEHVELAVSLVEEIPRVLAACPEPLGSGQLPVLEAAFRAIPGARAITAAGGDELFAGHPRYLRAARHLHSHRAARAADLLRTIAPQRHRGRLQRAASKLRTRGPGRARALVEVFSLDERRALLGGYARSAQGATATGSVDADAAIAFDLEIALEGGVLAVQQTASACTGVEVSSPFLDARLARAVVPPAARHKLGRAHGNRLLREAIADLIPRDALTPPPRAPPPLGAWLRGPLRPMLKDLVGAPSARIRAFFDPRAIDAVVRHALEPRGDPRQAWALFALEVWLRER